MTCKRLIIFLFLVFSLGAEAQDDVFRSFLRDSVMTNASVALVVADADSSTIVYSYNPLQNLIPASTMKLVTSAAAIELLGPSFTFRTTVGYTGIITRSGTLNGDLIIRGGGDPCLGADFYNYHYQDFTGSWIESAKKAGVRKIKGRIITDDSYYDYEPAAPRWLWEDLGVYYGAGVFGLSVFDNSCKIKVRAITGSNEVKITAVEPALPGFSFANRLKSETDRDNWYVYSAPYSKSGWLSGYIPADTAEYTLDAAIPDPPLLMATMLNDRMMADAIKISGSPATTRTEKPAGTQFTPLTETTSPLLSQIIDRLNKESINLYAEHLVKELGKQYRGTGSTVDGLYVIREFLSNAGIDTTGLFIEDGSGLSARNGINADALTKLLIYMRNKGKYFPEFYSSLPEAGKNGTLSRYFTGQEFESNLKAKSGSMTRVRCYAGYFTSASGKNMVFCILVNNFRGDSPYIINNIERILSSFILYK